MLTIRAHPLLAVNARVWVVFRYWLGGWRIVLTNGSYAGLERTSMNAIFMAVEMILATMADHILRAHLTGQGTETQGRAGLCMHRGAPGDPG